MTWTNPTLSIGTIVALVILIAVSLLGFMGQMPKEQMLLIAAVCAVRL